MKTSLYIKFASRLALFFAFIASISVFAETKSEGGYSANLKASRDGSVYSVGETATFALKVEKDGKAVDGIAVDMLVCEDGGFPPKHRESVITKDGLAKVSGSLKKAGFLTCKAFVKIPSADDPSKTKILELYAGAAFDPLNIEPSAPVPEDFDSYWNKQKQILSAIPMELKTEEVPSGDKNIKLFHVEAKTFNGFLRGYLAYPSNAAPASLPAVLVCHGAGVSPSFKGVAIDWARSGFIAMDFNAHGILSTFKPEEYKRMFKEELKGYYIKNPRSRDKVFFRELYLRDLRAVDVITSFPQWDGKNLVAFGGSQGGGQALALGGLSEKVSLAVPLYPAVCDHSGPMIGRTCGWPHFSRVPDAEIAREMAYIDGVNMATRFKCPAIFMINYADDVCEPTSCYAAYNAVKTPKKLVVNEESRHTPTSKSMELVKKLVRDFCFKGPESVF